MIEGITIGSVMTADRPVEVAVVGGGCAAIAAAFELTRPEQGGRYHVTLYQLGWRLGGKGASGRGPCDRIEEHGLHVWLGFYENAFRLLRECYAELGRDARTCRFAKWSDAFMPDPHIGIADQATADAWLSWTAYFPAAPGLPGDPVATNNPFTLGKYLARAVALLRTLLLGVESWPTPDGPDAGAEALHQDRRPETMLDRLVEGMATMLRYGTLATMAALIEALALLDLALKALPDLPDTIILPFVERLAATIRGRLADFVTRDQRTRHKWEIVDLILAILVGTVRFRLLSDPRGLEVIDAYDCREWLRMNGASERSLESPFVRGLYDLAMAYEAGDPARPGLAAGQALRGSLRMFFSYRGAMLWKMRAGMGDVVFAPFYEVLKRRGVTFEFFHRLENVRLAPESGLAPGEHPYVAALEFDVQATIVGGGEYDPLVDVKGVRSWPGRPDYRQLEAGAALEADGWEFESHWDRRRAGTRTLEVTRDFDAVVLAVGVGAIPYVCGEILARDARWRDMVAHVKTVATQAFQIWLRADLQQLGWVAPPVTLSAFIKPFDTWADMGHLIPVENWPEPPRTLAYFCGVLADPPVLPSRDDVAYPHRRRAEVRRNATHFLNTRIAALWPGSSVRPGQFRWDLLVGTALPPGPEAGEPCGEARFDTQFWTANVNPSDRYVLALPGSLQYRISPLDNTYDNLTIAGDWTDCGFNEGCVEAAMMSGRLAAHAIAQSPALDDIVGYDHP
jgi:uncharacterized protein with NAD-binding domain and iron-sulfur cluster